MNQEECHRHHCRSCYVALTSCQYNQFGSIAAIVKLARCTRSVSGISELLIVFISKITSHLDKSNYTNIACVLINCIMQDEVILVDRFSASFVHRLLKEIDVSSHLQLSFLFHMAALGHPATLDDRTTHWTNFDSEIV